LLVCLLLPPFLEATAGDSLIKFREAHKSGGCAFQQGKRASEG
jgi:hypothetical protein